MMSRAEYLEYHESEMELRMGQAEPLEQCQACGGEIYAGQKVWVVDNRAIHARQACLAVLVGLGEMTVESWLAES